VTETQINNLRLLIQNEIDYALIPKDDTTEYIHSPKDCLEHNWKEFIERFAE
jgi:hypothetical protein